MIGVQTSREKIGDRGRDVALNLDREGAQKLIKILQLLIDRDERDHEHISAKDGWEDIPHIKDDSYFELANGLDINFCSDLSDIFKSEALT